MARPAAGPAKHQPPKHRILRSVPDLIDDSDHDLIGRAQTLDPTELQIPDAAMSATLYESRMSDTVRLLERKCEDLQGRLLVLRGQTAALTEENIGLRADLYNLMQAVEESL